MSKSIRVSSTEFQAALRLLRELSDLPRYSVERSVHLLNGLCRMVGARTGSDFTWRRVWDQNRWREHHEPGVMVGYSTDELRRVSQYIEAVREPDPLTTPITQAVAKGPVTLRRQELIADHRWRNSAYYNEFRVPAGVAETIVHAVPVAGGKVRTIGLYRPHGDSTFTLRQSRLMSTILIHAVPMVGPAAPAQPAPRLSPREQAVLARLLTGDAVKAIAYELGISTHTTGDYVKSIYKKLGVKSRPQLLARHMAAAN